jgi:hypothetical protein
MTKPLVSDTLQEVLDIRFVRLTSCFVAAVYATGLGLAVT